MKLSILIPTLPDRKNWLARVKEILAPQLGPDVQILEDERPKIPTGSKRNDLIRRAQGDYITFVDDDDRVAPFYVRDILNAMQTSPLPDVITFQGQMTTNGRHPVNWVIKLGEDWVERKGVYYRFPNHLAVIKRDIALRVPFENIYQQEDYKFACKLRDLKLLKTEVHIPKQLYFYDFRTNK